MREVAKLGKIGRRDIRIVMTVVASRGANEQCLGSDILHEIKIFLGLGRREVGCASKSRNTCKL